MLLPLLVSGRSSCRRWGQPHVDAPMHLHEIRLLSEQTRAQLCDVSAPRARPARAQELPSCPTWLRRVQFASVAMLVAAHQMNQAQNEDQGSSL